MAALRVGVLSFAHPHALGYVRALAAQPELEVVSTDVGLGDPGTLRGPELAAELGVTYLPDVAAVLATRPDAVIVTSDNAGHRDLVEQALAAGADVLCEKPLATTDADADAMVRAAENAGQLLMTAYPVRFSPAFGQLLARVRAGQLGRILSVQATNNGKMPLAERSWFTDPQRSGGGALVDHVVHVADLLDELLGEPAREVHALTNRIMHAETGVQVETGAMVTITYPGGVIAQLDSSWHLPDSAPTWGGLTLEVHGTEGAMRIDPFSQHLAGYDTSGALWDAYGPDLDAAMIGEFLDAVRSRRTPRPDGATGARTLAVVTAAQRSAATGEIELVKP